MNPLGTLVFLGWIPITLCIFAMMPPRKAAIVSAVSGWLLVPNMRIPLPGVPDYSKITASVVGILLGTLIFDGGRFSTFRFRRYDLPILGFCLGPFITSVLNDLGPYDGMAESLSNITMWGLPYFIGRIYFTDLDGLRALAIGVAGGGLYYVLPCLYEIRMSPVLQNKLYGFGHYEGTRYGGFRPHVFLATGLELGMYMTAASLVAYWLWAKGGLRRLWGYSFGAMMAALLVTTVLCKSTGALMELVMGIAVLHGATLWVAGAGPGSCGR